MNIKTLKTLNLLVINNEITINILNGKKAEE